MVTWEYAMTRIDCSKRPSYRGVIALAIGLAAGFAFLVGLYFGLGL